MIQRIQSVYLLLGALAVAALLFFDVVWQSEAAVRYVWFTPVLLTAGIAAAVVALWSIFLYENRQRQRKVVLSAQLLTVLLALVLYGGLFAAGALSVTVGGTLVVARLVALLLPAVAYVLFFLARRAITSDIELVRSMDRLR